MFFFRFNDVNLFLSMVSECSVPPGVGPQGPNAGWASYASFDHVGASDLTLSLGGVINYALLDGTAYSLPPTFYFSEEATYPFSTTEAHSTQATSLSCTPASWPTCSQSSGASSLRVTSSASRSQPIYS